MYSLILAACLTGPTEATALPRLGGCSGFLGIRSAVVQIVANRPVRASAGCQGGFLGLFRGGIERSRSRTVTVTHGVAVAPPVQAQPEMMGAGPLTRLRVHRQLVRALQSDTLTTAQREVAQRALRGDRVTVGGQSHRLIDLLADKALSNLKTKGVGAIGDGTLWQIFIDSLPALLEFISALLKLFA